jgi:hypothetical protein
MSILKAFINVSGNEYDKWGKIEKKWSDFCLQNDSEVFDSIMRAANLRRISFFAFLKVLMSIRKQGGES